MNGAGPDGIGKSCPAPVKKTLVNIRPANSTEEVKHAGTQIGRAEINRQPPRSTRNIGTP